MSKLPKAIYRFNAIPTKIPRTLFTEIEPKIVKIYPEYKILWRAKAILLKKRTKLRVSNSWFQTILWSYNNLNSAVLAYKHIDQWNRIEWPEKFLTRKPRILNGENMVSSINDVWKTEYSHAEEWSLIPILHHLKN